MRPHIITIKYILIHLSNDTEELDWILTKTDWRD